MAPEHLAEFSIQALDRVYGFSRQRNRTISFSRH